MTRHQGQVRGWQALVGVVTVLLVVTATIMMMDVLLPPQDPEVVKIAEELARQTQGEVSEEEVPGVRSCPIAGLAPRKVTSTLLYECPAIYDGLTVTYTGEVVGQVLQRDDHAWVQLNDDAYANVLGPLGSHGVAAGANSGIGVRIPLAAAKAIRNVGANERQGDRIEVRGVFWRSYPGDGGGTVIRAEQVEIVEEGGPRSALTYPGRRFAALLLFPLTLLVVVVAFREQVADYVPLLQRHRWS